MSEPLPPEFETSHPVTEIEPTSLAGGFKPKSSGPRSLLYNRAIDKILILLIPTALFMYASNRNVLRLRAVMPLQFIDASVSPRQRASEERIAYEYWNCALKFVQWKYTYGSPLPAEPPEDFRIDDRSVDRPGAGAGPASRLRYWRRLQQLWLSPDSWTASREWSTGWLTEPIMKVVDGLESYVSSLWKAG